MKGCIRCCEYVANENDVCPNCGGKLLQPTEYRVALAEKGGGPKLFESIPTSQYTPHCPTCGSPDVHKIGAVERGASVVALGLFSKKINKSFKCGNCGYCW